MGVDVNSGFAITVLGGDGKVRMQLKFMKRRSKLRSYAGEAVEQACSPQDEAYKFRIAIQSVAWQNGIDVVEVPAASQE